MVNIDGFYELEFWNCFFFWCIVYMYSVVVLKIGIGFKISFDWRYFNLIFKIKSMCIVFGCFIYKYSVWSSMKCIEFYF